MLERLDDGNSAADRRLEGDLDAMGVCGMEDLLATRRHEGLVRRDDALPGAKRVENDISREVRAADELDDDVDIGIGDDVLVGIDDGFVGNAKDPEFR